MAGRTRQTSRHVKSERGTHSDLGTCKTRASIQTNSIPTCTTVHLNLPGVGLEVLRSIFSSDTTLNGEATFGNGLLRQTKLWKGGTGSNLDLGGDDVESSDLLYTISISTAVQLSCLKM